MRKKALCDDWAGQSLGRSPVCRRIFCLCLDELTIRIRDNCPEFDPRKRVEVFDPKSPEKNIGIRLTVGLGRQVDYYNNAGINTLLIKM